MIKKLLYLIFDLKKIGGLYLILLFYDSYIKIYSLVGLYHIRATMQFLKAFIPIETQITLFIIIFSYSFFRLIKKIIF